MAKTKSYLHQRIFTSLAINTNLFGCKNQSGDKDAGQISQTGAVSLFNGYSFDGWNADTNYFDIRDSVIIGGTLLGPIEDMVWITTQKEYA